MKTRNNDAKASRPCQPSHSLTFCWCKYLRPAHFFFSWTLFWWIQYVTHTYTLANTHTQCTCVQQRMCSKTIHSYEKLNESSLSLSLSLCHTHTHARANTDSHKHPAPYSRIIKAIEHNRSPVYVNALSHARDVQQ